MAPWFHLQQPYYWPRVWFPITPSTLFSIGIIEIGIGMRKERNKQKEAGIGPFKQKLDRTEHNEHART